MKNMHLWTAMGLAACAIFFSVDLWNAQPEPSALKTTIIPIPEGATGPESFVFDPDGEGPYTGVSDGRILKWQGEELGWLDYAIVTPHHL